LKNITLKKGKVEGSTYEATGGAIKAGNGSVLTLDNTDIADSEAGIAGGAISSTGNIDIKGNSVIRNNRTISSNGLGGAIYNGGILKISGSAKITVDSGKNDVYLPADKVIIVTDALTEDSVARITPADNTYTEGREVVKGEGHSLTNGDISKFSLTQKSGQTWSLQRDSAQNALVLKKEATEITTWKGLQDAVDAADDNDIITVKNTLTADGSTSEISITKNLTIKGEGTSTVLNANYKHRIFNVYNEASLKLKDITLEKGKDSQGAGVHVTGASLEIENVTITECKNETSLGEGGAIYISSSSNGRLWIKGSSKILSNTAEKGAGIYIDTNLGENIIEGSTEIRGNICQSNGKGGGIYLYKGKLVLKDNAKILNNESSVGIDGGGGVYISEHGTLTIKDSCIIQGNKAKNSGGSVITGNGGGIYNSGNLIMEGGEIKDNEAKLGGAVYNNGTFKISGSAKIELSEGSDENTPGKNDIYLPADKVITVIGSLTEDSVARISPENYPSIGNPIITVLTADSSVNLADQVSRFKVTNDPDEKKWKVNDAGKLEKDNQGKTVKTWADLKTEVETADGAEVIIVEGTLTAGGSSDEITVKRNITIKGKDNSAILDANKKCRIFTVKGNKNLILENLTLQNGDATKLSGDKNGGAIYLNRKASLEIRSGVIIKDNKAKQGGGIYIEQNAELLMTGGTIENNIGQGDSHGEAHGGAVYVHGTFKMSGSAQITYSTGEDEHKKGKNDVYLTTGKSIELTGALTSLSNQAARISVHNNEYSEGKVVLEGAGTVNLSNEAKKFKVTKKGSQNWYVGNNGQLTTTASGP